MRFSPALFVALSAFFVTAVAVSQGASASRSYEEEHFPKGNNAAGHRFEKGYEEKYPHKENGATSFRDEMAYDKSK
ncbi:uncharacterized protein N7500_000887 [Penicillium coprophilum]|uniref:uncharacterized protein n=1 Tax=Penicillium coprophilum TaxID=36646 RepID=UPI002399FFC0|nr:uncharacterized protein N7500_000887 [Penicillium coprophilum]KAJ5178188.1 hypothetical protein N7500_000887 [Penicillium coprophilum]